MPKKFLKTIVTILILTIMLPLVANAEIIEPDITGTNVLTMDMETGEVIYSKNADEKVAIASTTKLLTALIFAEHKKKTDLIPYTQNSINLTETALNNFMGGNLKPGDTMTADDVMKAVLIYSANDAALMMAESVAGSEEKFAEMMNKRASEIGVKDSTFSNPHGLEFKSINYSTPYDLALIARAAFNNEWIRETLLIPSTKVMINGLTITIDQKHNLLNNYGNLGGKTGTEDKAGRCFVGFFERDGRKLVSVILGADFGVDGQDVFKETLDIVDYSYPLQKTLFKKANETIGTVELKYKAFRFFGPEKTITAPLILTEDAMIYNNDFNDKYTNIKYDGDTSHAWDISKDNNVKLTLYSKGFSETVSGKINITKLDLIKDNFAAYIVAFIVIILILFLILFLYKIIAMKKRKNKRFKFYGR